MARSLLGSLLGSGASNTAPVPYTRRQFAGVHSPTGQHNPGKPLAAMREVPGLFPIVAGGANATARTEWQLWRTAASGAEEDRTLIPNAAHLASKVLNRPNPWFWRSLLFETVQQWVELAGIGYLVADRSNPLRLPMELWPVRPDRMYPVPDPQNYLIGYVYTGPDGEKVPLDADQVIPIRAPDPEDLYGGLSPIPSLATDLDAGRLASSWTRNFFLNDATPGGVVIFEDELSDTEFEDFRERWRAQHQGVSNAGRVALLERNAKWQDRSFSIRDLQLTEMRTLMGELQRRGFAFPKHLLGDADVGNRATAEAQNAMFGQWYVTPRLDRWKGALNHFYLPMFGETGAGVELDYEDPVPADADAQNLERDSKTKAAVAMVGAGFDALQVLEWLELPELAFTAPAPPTIVAPPGAPGASKPAVPAALSPRAALLAELDAKLAPAPEPVHVHPAHAWILSRPAAEAPGPPPSVDLAAVQAAWEDAKTRLSAQYHEITSTQRDDLVRQVRVIVETGDLSKLADMKADSQAGALLIAEFMRSLAQLAGEAVAAEALAQGVSISPAMPADATIAATASVTAAVLANELALSAAREAMRVHSPASSPGEVGDHVAEHLRSLTGASADKQLGAALTGAQNGGRLATFEAGPVAALYADETLDKNTCGPCRAINGRWLGNSDGTDFEMVEKTYPMAGYIDCLGGTNCRGTVTGVWRSKTIGSGE